MSVLALSFTSRNNVSFLVILSVFEDSPRRVLASNGEVMIDLKRSPMRVRFLPANGAISRRLLRLVLRIPYLTQATTTSLTSSRLPSWRSHLHEFTVTACGKVHAS